MNRSEILQQLRAYSPTDEREQRMLERITDFVSANESCHDRNLQIGHLTGSAWIVDRERTHTLLTHHARLGIWVQLGGHVEDDPDMLSAAWREAREESGLRVTLPVGSRIFDVDVHEIPPTSKEPAHFHFDIRYQFEADRSAELRVTPESKSLRWIALENVTDVTQEESILRMVRKTMRQRE
jgi:8-oxo-dGTP pyrophosphatase MutT (NUDIX family)